MSSEHKYFRDRLILGLLAALGFLIVLCTLLILLRLGGGRSEGYIVQYRSSLGVSPFKSGSVSEIIAFIPFSILVGVVCLILSMRLHAMNRGQSAIILGFGILLVLLTIVVSNALLVV